jgi:DNA-binding IclR family transcriptional regulator
MSESAERSTIRRLVGVLDAFDASHAVLTASDISRRSSLPMSTTHRIVADMVDCGLLERGAGKKLRVGARAWELASRSQHLLNLREVAKPFLEGLHSVVRQHVQLGVREDRDVLFVELLSSHDAVVNITRVASKLPVHTCSSGQVLVAFASVAVQEDVLGSPLPPLTDRTITTPTALRRRWAEVRRQGYAVSKGEVHLDAAGVAAPIFDARRQPVGSVSVIVPNDSASIGAAIPVVRAAGRGVSRAIGG